MHRIDSRNENSELLRLTCMLLKYGTNSNKPQEISRKHKFSVLIASVLWYVTLYSLLEKSQHCPSPFWGQHVLSRCQPRFCSSFPCVYVLFFPPGLLFYPEDGGSKFIRNITVLRASVLSFIIVLRSRIRYTRSGRWMWHILRFLFLILRQNVDTVLTLLQFYFCKSCNTSGGKWGGSCAEPSLYYSRECAPPTAGRAGTTWQCCCVRPLLQSNSECCWTHDYVGLILVYVPELSACQRSWRQLYRLICLRCHIPYNALCSLLRCDRHFFSNALAPPRGWIACKRTIKPTRTPFPLILKQTARRYVK
jgi:hypothetical protein